MIGTALRVTAIVWGVALAVSAPAAAQIVSSYEDVEVVSLTLSDAQMLSGDVAGAPEVALGGRLSVPRSDVPAPLVILLHGSGGAGGAQLPTWTGFLNEHGIAVLALDSYTARGHEEIFSDQSRVGEFQPVFDLYRAVEAMADDARIDESRMAVMGFSRGGIGALYSAMTRFQERYGPQRGSLVAHLPFYPPCNFVLDRDTEVGPAPIRLFHGDADNWNPAPACRAYVERVSAAGADIEMITYPGAHHGFDNPGVPAYFVVAEAQTSRRCMRREADGLLVNEATGRPFSWKDVCVETKPAQRFHLAGYEAVREDVLRTLTAAFDRP